MFKLIKKYLKDYILYIIGAIALVLLQTYVQIVLAMGEMKTILEEGVLESNMSIVYASSIKMLLYTILIGVIAVGVSFLSSRIAGIMISRIRTDCYNKVLNLSIDKFEEFGSSSLLTRTVYDARYISSLIQFAFSRVIMLPVAVIFVLVITYRGSREIFDVYVISLVVSITVMAFFRMMSQKYYSVYRRIIDSFTKNLTEKITGVRTVRAFASEKTEEEKGFEEDAKLRKAAIKSTKPLCLMNSLSLLVLNLSSMVIFIVAAKSIQRSLLTVNEMVFLLQYLNFTITILALLPSLINLMPKAIVSANQVWELINVDTKNDSQSNEVNPDKSGTLEFRDVSFRYPNGSKVLSHVSFTLNSKETLAIVGATGSGKTTLLDLMLGFYKITDGDILIDGVSISKYSDKDLFSRFSYSAQKNSILQDSIRNNITALREDISEEEISQACKCSCFDVVLDSLPDGLETKLSKGGTNLSGGQCKRLMLTRALLKDAEIYLFDEPIAALDSVTGSKVKHNLNEFLKDKTKVIVSSKINSINDADHILVLDFGHVVGYGTHDELLKTCEIYKDLHELQMSLEQEMQE